MKALNIDVEYQMQIHSTQQNLQMTRYAQFIAMEIIVVLRTNIMIKPANCLTQASRKQEPQDFFIVNVKV